MITVLRQLDDNWYEGELGNQIGIFPLAYVEVSDHSALFGLFDVAILLSVEEILLFKMNMTRKLSLSCLMQ